MNEMKEDTECKKFAFYEDRNQCRAIGGYSNPWFVFFRILKIKWYQNQTFSVKVWWFLLKLRMVLIL